MHSKDMVTCLRTLSVKRLAGVAFVTSALVLPLFAGEAAFKNDVEKAKLSAAWKKINPEEIIKDVEANPYSHPITFQDLGLISSGSQAEKLGITVDSKILKVDRTPDGDGEVMWVDKNGEVKKGDIESGNIGTYFYTGLNITSWYIGKGKKDEKWDSMVVAALQSQGQDVKLADAFWHKAMELGYKPDALSNTCGFIIALERNDVERAEAFANKLLPIKEIPKELVSSRDWYRLAGLTGNPEWILKAADACDIEYNQPVLGKRARQLAESQKEFAKASEGKSLKPPSELAKTMKRTSFLGNAVTDSNWVATRNDKVDFGNRDHVLKKMFSDADETKELDKQVIPGAILAFIDNRVTAWIGPKQSARDMDVTFTLKFAPCMGRIEMAEYQRHAHIALASRNSKLHEDAIPYDTQIIGLTINHDRFINNTKESLAVILPSKHSVNRLLMLNNPFRNEIYKPSYIRPMAPLGKKVPIKIRLVRVGSQAEIFMNGERLALAHVPLDRTDLGLGIFVCGAMIQFDAITADILE